MEPVLVHEGAKYRVARKKKGGEKTVVTTLPVGAQGNLFLTKLRSIPREQALLLTVAPKASSWKKQWLIRDEGRYSVGAEKLPLFDAP